MSKHGGKGKCKHGRTQGRASRAHRGGLRVANRHQVGGCGSAPAQMTAGSSTRMGGFGSLNSLARAFAAATLVLSAAASASQFEYSLYGGVTQSDNINLASTHPDSQSVLTPGVNFTYDEQGADLTAHAHGNLEYRSYPGGTYKNQSALELASQALWVLSPERLDLAVQDYAGVQPLDSRASDAPNNRQQTNVFTIGPVLHFRLGGTLRGQAELRYIDSYASKTNDFNSRRGQAALHVLKDLSPTDHLSINVDTQHVDFYRDPAALNYNRQDVFAGYASKLARFDVNLALGSSRIDYRQAGVRSRTSPLARIDLDWRVTPQSTIAFSGSRQYSDAAGDLMLRPGGVTLGNPYGIGTGEAVVSPQVFLERYAELSYSYRGERFDLQAAPYYQKLSYMEDPSFDQTNRGGRLALGWRMRPTLTLSVFAQGEELRYEASARRDRTVISGIGVTGQRTSHWSWRALLQHQHRTSNVSGQGFSENEIYVGLVYKR